MVEKRPILTWSPTEIEASSPRKAFLAFDGGTAEGDPCDSAGHHGYAGIEAQVVDAIVAFVAGR